MNRELIARVWAAACGRCEYCRLPERTARLPFQIDHIFAVQHGGLTDFENLALACFTCNKHKGPNLASLDSQDGQPAWLFHPRHQEWRRHFRWDGAILLGRTRAGRATVRALAINLPNCIARRAILLEEGTFHADVSGVGRGHR